MPETTGVQLTGGVSQTGGLDIGGLLSGLLGSGANEIQQALQGGPVTALALNASRTPRDLPRATPIPPYVPEQPIQLPLQPTLVADSGAPFTSDAQPTPYQVWQMGQPQGYQPPQPVGPQGQPLPQYGTAQGYPGIQEPVGLSAPQYGMQPPPGGWGPPPGMIPPRPQQIQSPYLNRARQINQLQGQLGAQMAAPPPYIPPPQVDTGRIARMRGVLNKNYANNQSAQQAANASMYNKMLDQQWSQQKAGLDMVRDAARETYQQEAQIAREEYQEQQKAIAAILETGKQQHYREAEEFMATKISARPTPQRTRWIIDTFNRTRGLIDLRDKIYMDYSAVATQQDNRQQTLENKKQLFKERDEMFDYKLRKAKAGAETVEDRAEIIHATKDTVKELYQIRKDKAALDLELSQSYGDALAQSQLAVRQTALLNAERGALDTARKGATGMIGSWQKLEQLYAQTGDKRYKDQIREAFGDSRKLTDEEAIAQARQELGPKKSENQELLRKRAAKIQQNYAGLPKQIAGAYSWMENEFPGEAVDLMAAQRAVRSPQPPPQPQPPAAKLKASYDGAELLDTFLDVAEKRGQKPPDKYTPEEQKLIRDMTRTLGART